MDPIRSYLLQSPPVVESIFKFLPARDLSSCAKVCKSWNVIAKSDKKKRILVSIIPEFDEILHKGRITEIFSELFSEPHLAIYFDEIIRKVCNAAKAINSRLNHSENKRSVRIDGEDYRPTEEDEMYCALKQKYDTLRSEAQQGYDFNNCLPTKCTSVITAPLLTLFHYPGMHNLKGNFKPMILIPSIDGIEIEPFSLPFHGDLCVYDVRQIEPLHPTREVQSKIKCLVLFLNENCTEGETHNFTNRICDNIIIVQYYTFASISTGISIAGDRVRVECVAMNEKRCCIKYCFSVLLSHGFNEEYGLAFCKTYVGCMEDDSRIMYVKEAFELFPKVVVPNDLIHVIVRHDSIMNTTVKSLERCNECGSLQDGTDCRMDPVVIVFIFFKDISVEIINN